MSLPPNLLVILTHGHRADAAGYAGAWPIDTPALDALARDGLERVAISSSTASGPARRTLHTGLHARQHGQLDDQVVPTPAVGWARSLAAGGYHLAAVGNLGGLDSPPQQSIEIADSAGADPHSCPYLQHVREAGGLAEVLEHRRLRQQAGPFALAGGADLHRADDIDSFLTRQAAGLLRQMPGHQPWALTVAYSGPGNELPAPRQSFDAAPAGLTDGFVPADARRLDRLVDCPYPRALLQRLDAEAVARIRRHYLARVQLIDEGIGHLRRELGRRPDGERTWIILCCDHGYLLGEQGLVGHRSMLGAALYVPLYLVPPAAWGPIDRDGQDPRNLVSTVDLAPTLCALGRADPPAGCIGHSLLPALRGGQLGHEAVISEYGGRLMMENDRYRVVYDVDTREPRMLIDLARDPREDRDLLDTPQGLGVLDMLRWQLAGALMGLRPVSAALH